LSLRRGSRASSAVIYYRNVHPDQEVTIEVNGSPAGTFRLPNTGMHAGRLLFCSAELRHGNNTMNLRFAKWAPPHEISGRSPCSLRKLSGSPVPELPREPLGVNLHFRFE